MVFNPNKESEESSQYIQSGYEGYNISILSNGIKVMSEFHKREPLVQIGNRGDKGFQKKEPEPLTVKDGISGKAYSYMSESTSYFLNAASQMSESLQGTTDRLAVSDVSANIDKASSSFKALAMKASESWQDITDQISTSYSSDSKISQPDVVTQKVKEMKSPELRKDGKENILSDYVEANDTKSRKNQTVNFNKKFVSKVDENNNSFRRAKKARSKFLKHELKISKTSIKYAGRDENGKRKHPVKDYPIPENSAIFTVDEKSEKRSGHRKDESGDKYNKVQANSKSESVKDKSNKPKRSKLAPLSSNNGLTQMAFSSQYNVKKEGKKSKSSHTPKYIKKAIKSWVRKVRLGDENILTSTQKPRTYDSPEEYKSWREKSKDTDNSNVRVLV